MSATRNAFTPATENEARLWRDALRLRAAQCGLLAGTVRVAEGHHHVVHAWAESIDGWRPAGQRAAVEPWKALVVDPFDPEETAQRGWGPIDYNTVGPFANDRARLGGAAALSPGAGRTIGFRDYRESEDDAQARVGTSLFYAWPADDTGRPLDISPEQARDVLLGAVRDAIAALPDVPSDVLDGVRDDERWLHHVASCVADDAAPTSILDLSRVHGDNYEGGIGYRVAVAANLASWRMGDPLYRWWWTRSKERAVAALDVSLSVAEQIGRVRRAVDRLPSLREELAATTLYMAEPHVWTADAVVEWVCEAEVAVMRWRTEQDQREREESAARRARHDGVRTERTRARSPQTTQPSGFGTLGDLLKAKGKPLK